MNHKFTLTAFAFAFSMACLGQTTISATEIKLEKEKSIQLSLENQEAEIFLKRKLENSQADLKSEPESKPSTLMPNPSCTNMDFELGTANGWTITNAPTLTPNNSCSMLGCCTGTNTTYTVVSNGYIDPLIPTTPLNSQFGIGGTGTKFIKLNDATAGGDQQRLSQSFSVTPANAMFKYAYKFISSAGGHLCCDEAFMNIRFKNASGNFIPLAQPFFSLTLSSTCPTGYTATSAGTSTCTGNPSYQHTPWIFGSADLSAHIGSFVTFELTVGDCSAAGHTGHVYFDATCTGLTYSVNSNSMPLDSTNNLCVSTLPTTLTAPNGFASYGWITPTGPVSGQSINVSSYGVYTMSLTSLGTCCPYYKVINVSACTGITHNTTKSAEMFIYPNPAKKEITFENVSSGASYSIYDMLGNKVRDKEIISDTRKSDISELSSGVYFIKVLEPGGQNKTFKIIKD